MAQSFVCPHGHQWEDPFEDSPTEVGNQTIPCPVCGAATAVTRRPDTLPATQALRASGPVKQQPPPAPESDVLSQTALQAQLETWRKMPPPDLPKLEGYEILSELGRGGMGVVYRAKQRKLKRVVALKMILAGEFAGTEALNRFRSEAEAVARMQHQNIVQIYEVGEQDNRPYMAMEFVDGGSLHDLLENPLPARQAAQLTVRLARAMHFAHQQGIVHRDLKPANVLLTKAREPKITDFGLAKKLDEAKGQTRTGDVLGTPSYMAPEQAEGKIKDIGPATDVYALGAILYEMLTARQPFQAETAMDTLLQVLYEEPVAPAQLVPKLPADLETICLKCLSKEIGKRYSSAAELADDLERFLENKPILARPASPISKVVKWARRRPALAALVGVVVLAVIGGLAASLWFNIQLNSLNTQLAISAENEKKKAKEAEDERKAADVARVNAVKSEKKAVSNQLLAEQREKEADVLRRRAELNFQKAREAVKRMLSEVGQTELAHIPFMEQVRQRLLTEALKFNLEFLEKQGDEPAVRWQAAQAHQQVAEIHKMLGNFPQSLQENEAATGLLTKLVADFSKMPDYQQDLAAAYLFRGQVFRETGKHAEAEAAYREALKIQEKLVTDHNRPEHRRELAKISNDLAQVLRNTGRTDEARKGHRRAIDLHDQLVKEQPDKADFREGLAGSLNDYGAFLRAVKEPDQAEKAYRQALQHFKELTVKWPESAVYRQKLAATYNNLGNVLIELKDYPQALDAAKEALAIRQKLAGQFPSVLLYRQDVAAGHNNLAAALASAGQPGEAEKEYQEALRIGRKLVEDVPRSPDYQSALAAFLDNFASLLAMQGRPAKARELLLEARKLHESARKTNPNHLGFRLFLRNHYNTQAETLLRAGEKGEAPRHVEAAAAAEEMLRHGDRADDYQRAAVLLARCAAAAEKDAALTDVDRKALAQKYAARAVALLQEAVNKGYNDVAAVKTSPLLNPLRGREDFKKLLAEMEKK